MEKNHIAFLKQLEGLVSEDERYEMLKNYTLSLSLSELLDWNNVLFAQSDEWIDKILERGFSEMEKKRLGQHFLPFEQLELQIKNGIKKAA